MKIDLDISNDQGEIKQANDYHLVKLPINDPRAYILGMITNCCQSIGGNSEECVIDGVTKENNGFYVLLKDKTPKTQGTPLKNAQIDYNKFEIVGQGYLHENPSSYFI